MGWNYYKLRHLSLLQSAVCYKLRHLFYYKVRSIYYKFRQVLQSAMIITNCDSTDSRQYDILWWYHVNKYRAMRGNQSELASNTT